MIEYLDVQVADPRSDKEMRNAFQAESIELTIDGQALLHRRWVASDCSHHWTANRIGPRTSSGHYEKMTEPSLRIIRTIDAGQTGPRCGRTIGDQAESVVARLETTRRSKEIRDRWERDYKALVAQARELEKQIREIRDSARGIDNPLRDWAELWIAHSPGPPRLANS